MNAYSYTVKKDCSYLCMWMTLKLAGKKQNIDPMYTWDVLKDNVKYAKILLTITEPCVNPEFPQEQLKNYHARKSSNFFVVLRYGKSCQEMCGAML